MVTFNSKDIKRNYGDTSSYLPTSKRRKNLRAENGLIAPFTMVEGEFFKHN